MNAARLKEVAARLRSGASLTGSRWRNAEVEDLAERALRSCDYNLTRYSDAFSWVGTSVASGVLAVLVADGSLAVGPYAGSLAAPSDAACDENGQPLALRVTDALVDYAEVHTRPAG